MLWFLVIIIVIPLTVSSPVYATEITSSTNKTVCVRPTDQPHIHCDCHLQTETDCRTLDEWISLGVDGSSKLNPFTSNTTVILLAGVHLINSTENQLLIEGVHSLVLTGDKSNTSITTVTCIQDFSIAFVNSNHVSLSTIAFNSCALRFSIVNNTQLINLSVINSRLAILQKGYEDLGYGRVDDEKQCKYLDDFAIIDSTFQNFPIYSAALDTLSTSCTQINLRGVLFKDVHVAELNPIHIVNAYNVILTNVTIYNFSSTSGSVSILSVHMLTLRNVEVTNNSKSATSDLLDLQLISTIIFAGDFIFKNNHGGRGIVLRQVKKIWTAPNSILMIEKKLYRSNLFHFEGDTIEPYSELYIDTKNTLIFEHNHVQGAIMRLDAIHLHVNNSKIIFRRNKGLETESVNNTLIPNAVLLLRNTECSFSLHSTLNFSHNTALLSGGITLFNSIIQFVPTTVIYFEYNEGGDGGGMAFYQKSYISGQLQESDEWPELKLNTETIDIHFYRNKAHRNGGGNIC